MRLKPHMLAAVIATLFLGATAEAETLGDAATSILKVHNRERAAVRVPPLEWDTTLAAHAAVWAKHLAKLGKLEHSTNKDRPGEGENLWMGTAGAYTPSEMADAWASEKSHFRYGAFPNVSDSGNWQVVGHYTQMIWRNTTKVGCAIASSKKWDILVCRYSPPGNWMGEKPY